MAAARYWRLVGVDTRDGGDLEMGELQLYDATGRVDGVATLSGTPPASGALANLGDDNTATLARWMRSQYIASSFSLTWDFGAGVTKDINKLKIGAVASGTFLNTLALQSSDDAATWVTTAIANRPTYPGAFALATINRGAMGSVNIMRDGSVSLIDQGPSTFYGFTAANVNNGLVDVAGFTVDQTSGSNNGRGVSVTFSRPVVLARWTLNRLTTVHDVLTEYNNGAGWAQADIQPNKPGGSTTNPRNFDMPASMTVAATQWRWSIANWDSAANYATNFYIYEVEVYEASGTTGVDANPPPRMARQVLFPTAFKGSPLPAGATSSHLKPIPFFDAYNGGIGIIYGTVKEKSTPVNISLRRRVVLIDERSQITIRETWSDIVTGYYEFRGVREGVPYTVLPYDHLHNYRVAGADNLFAEVRP